MKKKRVKKVAAIKPKRKRGRPRKKDKLVAFPGSSGKRGRPIHVPDIVGAI